MRAVASVMLVIAAILLFSAPALPMARVERIELIAEYATGTELVREFLVRLADGTELVSGETIAFGDSARGKTALQLKNELIAEGKGELLELPPGTEISPRVIRQWQEEGYDWRIERESAARPRPAEQQPAPPAPKLRVVIANPSNPPFEQQEPLPSRQDTTMSSPEDPESIISGADEQVLQDIVRQDQQAIREAQKARAKSWLHSFLDWLARLWERIVFALSSLLHRR